MANWSNPTTSSLYTDVLDILKDRDVDAAKMFDGTTSSNIPTGAIKWNSTSNKFEKWSGTAWGDLTTTNAFNNITASGNLTVDGNTTLGNATTDTVMITGTVQPGVVISGSSTGDAVRITQTGSGNALVVEDSTSPDSTPFVIDTNGRVLAGTTAYINAYNTTQNLILAGTGNPGITIAQASNSISPGIFSFAKSRGTTPGDWTTIVNSGDTLGIINFAGADGTTRLVAAQINAEVDGTPSTSSMPGRLIFSTTPSGSSTPSERMRIDSQGRIGIGVSPASTNSLAIGRNITGNTNQFVSLNNGTIQSDVQTEVRYYSSNSSTVSASFTLSFLSHYHASQGTFGSGSVVTNQYGFQAAGTLISASNNYGFFSNIGAGTTRTISNVERTSNVVTITTSAAHGYSAGQSVTVYATTNTGINGTFVIASVPTTTTFTYAQTGTDIASGADTGSVVPSGRWNFYAAGAAPNYFAGELRTLSTVTKSTTPTNSNTSSTATAASLISGLRTGTPTANINLTLPTGNSLDVAFYDLQNNQSFEWSVINLAAATYTITVVANTDHTVVGNMVVNANSSGRFLTRKTAANTFVTYRLS